MGLGRRPALPRPREGVHRLPARARPVRPGAARRSRAGRRQGARRGRQDRRDVLRRGVGRCQVHVLATGQRADASRRSALVSASPCARRGGAVGLVGATPGPDLAAAVTHLPCGVLVETRQRLAESRALPAWGRAVAGFVRDLARRAGRALMDRLAVLGHLAGRWGRPYRWVVRGGRLLELGRPFWESTERGTRRTLDRPASGSTTSVFVLFGELRYW